MQQDFIKEPDLFERSNVLLTLGLGGSAKVIRVDHRTVKGKVWYGFWLEPLKDFVEIYSNQIKKEDWQPGNRLYWYCPEEYIIPLNEYSNYPRLLATVDYEKKDTHLSKAHQKYIKTITQLKTENYQKELEISRLNRHIEESKNTSHWKKTMEEIKKVVISGVKEALPGGYR